jgi:carboxylate-amine ligase
MSRIAQYATPVSISGVREVDEPDRRESMLELQYRLGFSRGFLPTVGLEEELILVDPDSLQPACEAARLLEKLGDHRFAAELRTAQIELVMPVSLTVADLRRELVGARAHLFDVAGGEVRAIGAGAHPAATGSAGVTDRPRYRDIARDYPWAARRGMTCGLHVHVGVGDPDVALAVYNAARSYLPELAALAANSPFVDGSDSGLASARLKLTEELPRAGIPPAFASWRDLARFVAWGSGAGLFADLTYLWWDLRPRPEYGTIEFRVADSQTSVDASAAIAAICQSLVVALGNRHRAGEELPVHETHILNENRWLALRDGVDGHLADPATGAAEPTRDRIGRLLFELEPTARELGCADELALTWPLLTENGARRQRAVGGDVADVLAWLADETERSDDRTPESPA